MQSREQHLAIFHPTNLSVHSVTDLGQNAIQDALIYLVEVHLIQLSVLNNADN